MPADATTTEAVTPIQRLWAEIDELREVVAGLSPDGDADGREREDPVVWLEREVEALEAHVAALRGEPVPQLTLLRGGRDDG